MALTGNQWKAYGAMELALSRLVPGPLDVVPGKCGVSYCKPEQLCPWCEARAALMQAVAARR